MWEVKVAEWKVDFESLHILVIQTSSSLDEDLAPKNELCDEFLFTSHVMDAGPNMAVIGFNVSWTDFEGRSVSKLKP